MTGIAVMQVVCSEPSELSRRAPTIPAFGKHSSAETSSCIAAARISVSGFKNRILRPAAAGEGEVVGCGKAKIVFTLDKENVRKFRSHHFIAAVKGGVIDDKNFVGERTDVGADACKAIADECLRSPINNDDG